LQQPKRQDGVEPQAGVEKDGHDKGASMGFQECNATISYTQLLTSNIYDENLF
jgi:hypothetical protein